MLFQNVLLETASMALSRKFEYSVNIFRNNHLKSAKNRLILVLDPDDLPSQTTPKNPRGQLHLNAPGISVQVAPFLHGLEAQ